MGPAMLIGVTESDRWRGRRWCMQVRAGSATYLDARTGAPQQDEPHLPNVARFTLAETFSRQRECISISCTWTEAHSERPLRPSRTFFVRYPVRDGRQR